MSAIMQINTKPAAIITPACERRLLFRGDHFLLNRDVFKMPMFANKNSYGSMIVFRFYEQIYKR